MAMMVDDFVHTEGFLTWTAFGPIYCTAATPTQHIRASEVGGVQSPAGGNLQPGSKSITAGVQVTAGLCGLGHGHADVGRHGDVSMLPQALP
jgi:hypothetical protein